MPSFTTSYLPSNFTNSRQNIWELAGNLSSDAWENLKVGFCYQDRIYAGSFTILADKAAGLGSRLKHLVVGSFFLFYGANLIPYLAITIFDSLNRTFSSSEAFGRSSFTSTLSNFINPPKPKEIANISPFFARDFKSQTKEALAKEIEKNISIDNIKESTEWASSNFIQYFLQFLWLSSDFQSLDYPITTTKHLVAESIGGYLEKNPDRIKPLVVLVNFGGGHWTLLYIDHIKKTVEFYNSMGGTEPSFLAPVTQIVSEKTKGENYTSSYKSINTVYKKIQNDGHSCGIWTAWFAMMRLESENFDPVSCFKKKDGTIDLAKASSTIAEHRKRMQAIGIAFKKSLNDWYNKLTDIEKQKQATLIGMMNGEIEIENNSKKANQDKNDQLIPMELIYEYLQSNTKA
jgi:hypothetical protein